MNNTTEKHPIDNLYALLIFDKEREKIKAGEKLTPDQIRIILYGNFYINHYNKRFYKFYESLAKDQQIKLKFDVVKPRSNELIQALLYMFGYTPEQLTERKNEAINDAELKILKIQKTTKKHQFSKKVKKR
jgi:hypothetical protein